MAKIEVKHLEWTKNQTIYEVNLRQYTPSGTFKEFEEHLPRIKNLGVGILWFMPIQPIGEKNRKGTLGSYYSIKDYTAVNPMYGTLADFKNLVKKIHSMGMHVILDWVANHTAWDHRWTKEHPDFYIKDENGNFKPPVPEWEDVIDLDFSNQNLRRQMVEDMKYWLRECDIDGFRCDMAHLVPTDFWNDARPQLEAVKPVFMLAESELRELLYKAFDMIYNWNIHHTMNAIAKGEKSVHDLDNMLKREIYDFPEQAYQMLFTSNHDENSWQGSAMERLGIGLETFNVLAFTMHGMPLIYGGQEAAETRRIKFFDKDEIHWKDDKLYPFYQKLTTLKKRNEALWNGNFGGSFIRINSSNNWAVFAYLRKKDEKKVFVVLNLSHYEQHAVLHGDVYAGEYREVFTGKTEKFTGNNTIHLNPWGYKVFEI